MKYTDEQYLNAIDDLYGDDEAEIARYSREIVKTRKEHDCMATSLVDKKPHSIAIGSRCVVESAIVDGVPGSSYTCFDCLEIVIELVKA